MKRLSSYIPNIITCCNLTAGSLAVIMALRGTFEQAAIFILIAAVCDFLDGLSARLLHAYSDMGKELDSLSDLISFGLAPGLMVYALLNDYLLLPYGNLEYLAYYQNKHITRFLNMDLTNQHVYHFVLHFL